MKFLILVAGLGVATAVSAEEAVPNPFALLEQCEQTYAQIEDYTAVFVKHQRVRDRLRKPETIFLKFKKPYSIYMKWVKTPDAGKEVIYVEGQNENKIAAHPGGLLDLFAPLLYLEPNSPLAMSGNLKPVTHAGLGRIISSILEVCRAAQQKGDLALLYKGETHFEGRGVYVVQRFLPPDNNYPNTMALIYIDQTLRLPIYYAAYNAKKELLEEYIYRDVKLNVGLADNDFSVHNPEYHYRIF